jgi:hypothetical protein
MTSLSNKLDVEGEDVDALSREIEGNVLQVRVLDIRWSGVVVLLKGDAEAEEEVEPVKKANRRGTLKVVREGSAARGVTLGREGQTGICRATRGNAWTSSLMQSSFIPKTQASPNSGGSFSGSTAENSGCEFGDGKKDTDADFSKAR